MKTKLLYALPALLWMGVILSLTLQPAETSSQLSGGIVSYLYSFVELLGISLSMEQFHFIVRKTAHVSEYFILGLLVFVALKPHTMTFQRKMLIVFLFGIAFASVDEFIQTFVPKRVGAISDVLIDSVGVVLSLLVVFVYQKSRRESTV